MSFRVVFAHFITSAEADQYIAGCIILERQHGDYVGRVHHTVTMKPRKEVLGLLDSRLPVN